MTEVAKLADLKALGADRLDLCAIAPERLRQLATIVLGVHDAASVP